MQIGNKERNIYEKLKKKVSPKYNKSIQFKKIPVIRE